MSLTNKLKEILGPIFKDGQQALLYLGGIAAVIFLIVAFIKLKAAQDQSERRQIIIWMRIIVVAYIAVNLVAWLIYDYLQPSVSGNTSTTQIEQRVEKPHWMYVA
ncbi:hypothetical protein J6TS7_32470 [Paenibacillus dendritiformis]|uniref:hypothetical protein n=1 Tax=Paenibacillus TaxID=44249 RepID=UPI001B11C510|nr:hypothetical protein [Paenibacillus dendritiformis]GIO79637.1 hypothetical protein J6TS7_32470 [Paenibacillus dendritiformis]